MEVSPSDHGTTPISNFVHSSSILDSRLIRTLQSPYMNITKPTPIQSHAMPLLLNNYDVMASSATGSGKTLMFSLPLIEKLLTVGREISNKNNGMGLPTALIISPTRELAVQTAGVLNGFTKEDTSLRTKINVCLGKHTIMVNHQSSSFYQILTIDDLFLATGGSDSRNQRQLLPACNVLVGEERPKY